MFHKEIRIENGRKRGRLKEGGKEEYRKKDEAFRTEFVSFDTFASSTGRSHFRGSSRFSNSFRRVGQPLIWSFRA